MGKTYKLKAFNFREIYGEKSKYSEPIDCVLCGCREGMRPYWATIALVFHDSKYNKVFNRSKVFRCVECNRIFLRNGNTAKQIRKAIKAAQTE